MALISLFWKIWLGGAALLVVLLLSRMLFGAPIKSTLLHLPVALLWPLALLSREGRQRLMQMFVRH